MDNVSTDGFHINIERSSPLLPEISKMRVFVACENIKTFHRQIAAARDDADRGLLTRMLWEEEANLAAARAALRA
ncbi:MAG TPA: hypothetical protein DDZ81_21130 [Acetobacteraceae bacterium]|jgi:hypothetical protein|nr:hypothetical protein [Acetobacteraceae bacterium]